LLYIENIHLQSNELEEFSQKAFSEKYHGFLAGIDIGDAAKNFESVRCSFRDFIYAISETDESCKNSLNSDFMDLDWQFEFSNTRMFLNVFAPCYQQPHSKWINSDDHFFVFFQPEFSFDFCGISQKSDSTKKEIRAAFALAGIPYNGSLIDDRTEALLYMFPDDPFGPPVKWWE